MSANTVGQFIGSILLFVFLGLPIFAIWMYFIGMKIDVDNDGKGDI